jgi:hypothetical protein
VAAVAVLLWSSYAISLIGIFLPNALTSAPPLALTWSTHSLNPSNTGMEMLA